MMRNKEESKMINALHEKELFDQIMPAIRAAIKAGGGADQILKKSEPLAAATLAKAAMTGDVKAATEILNRVSGKPVERSVNIYGDISKMSERDVDTQIMMLLEKTGAKQLVANTLDIKPIKKSRKPRKSDPLADGRPTEEA